MEMDNANVTIHKLLTGGLIAKIAASSLQVGIWFITGTRDPIRLLLPPLISAGFFFLLYRLLEGYLAKTPAQQDASNPLLIGVAVPIAFSLIMTVLKAFLTVYWNRAFSIEEIGAISAASSYQGYAGIVSIATIPCFAAAAGMLYWRAKHAPQ